MLTAFTDILRTFAGLLIIILCMGLMSRYGPTYGYVAFVPFVIIAFVGFLIAVAETKK